MLLVQQLRAEDRGVLLPGRGVVVGRRLLVVPARQVGLVDCLGVRALRDLLLGKAARGHQRRQVKAVPGVTAPGREQRIGVKRADRVQPRVEVRDVLVVGVETVERVLNLVSRVEKSCGLRILSGLLSR